MALYLDVPSCNYFLSGFSGSDLSGIPQCFQITGNGWFEYPGQWRICHDDGTTRGCCAAAACDPRIYFTDLLYEASAVSLVDQYFHPGSSGFNLDHQHLSGIIVPLYFVLWQNTGEVFIFVTSFDHFQVKYDYDKKGVWLHASN
jgi:hypothetical protein